MSKKIFLFVTVSLLSLTFTFAQGTATDRKNVTEDKNRVNNDRAARDKAARQGKPHEAMREQKNLKEDKKDLKQDRKERHTDAKDEHQQKIN